MFLLSNYTIPAALILVVVALFTIPTLQQSNPIPRYLDVVCLDLGVGNYSHGSLYQDNLNILLSALDAQSPFSSYDTSIRGGFINTVYGCYYCRHDLSIRVCASCIQAATKKIVLGCPNFKEAVVYFEQCTLLYLNNSTRLKDVMFGGAANAISDLPSHYIMWYTPNNVTNPDKFYPVLEATISQVINESLYGSPELFATVEGRVPPLTTLYSMAQCNPDRTGRLDCERCLRMAQLQINFCCNQYVDMAFFLPSCQMRYSALGPFYDVPNPPPPMVSPRLPGTQVVKGPGHPTPSPLSR